MSPRRPRAAVVRYQPLDPHTRREAEALVAEGFEVDVLCLRDAGEASHEYLDGYRVRRIPLTKKRGSPLRYLFEYFSWFAIGFAWLTTQHARRRFRLVQITTLPDLEVFAAIVPKLTGAKIVVFLKEPTGELFETLYGSPRLGRAMNQLSDLAVRFSDLAFTVSEQHRQTYVDRGLTHRRIVPIVNSTPLEPLEVTARDRAPEPGAFIVICHGTIEERWGHETIVRAAALARDEIPGLVVRFTGRGTYLDELLELVAELGVGDIVEYLGFLSYSDLGQELMRAHVGVSAQKPSSYSHVVQTGKMYDFLGLGIPAIVTRLRSTAAYFSDGEVFFVAPDDPADMARAFVTLARDPERRTKLAAAGLAAFAPYRWAEQEALYRHEVRALLRQS